MCDAILRNHINKLQQTKSSAITTYANIPRVDRFSHFFVWFTSFIFNRKRSIALSVTQSSSPSTPSAWYFKLNTPTIYANIRCSFEMVERQS